MTFSFLACDKVCYSSQQKGDIERGRSRCVKSPTNCCPFFGATNATCMTQCTPPSYYDSKSTCHTVNSSLQHTHYTQKALRNINTQNETQTNLNNVLLVCRNVVSSCSNCQTATCCTDCSEGHIASFFDSCKCSKLYFRFHKYLSKRRVKISIAIN